jgi:hypothetical protein
MSGKIVRNRARRKPRRATVGWTTSARATAALAIAAGLAAASLLTVGLSGLTACSSRSAPPEFVQGGYSPAPAQTPRPIGPAPAPEK